MKSYRPFLGRSLRHSAKGSEWKDHKYIKRVDGSYYYPDNYEDGRHLGDKDVENLANETIKGSFGNGQTRKDLLGENYQQIQNRVNEIYGNKPISSAPEKIKEKGDKAAKKAIKKTMNMSIYSAYTKKKG